MESEERHEQPPARAQVLMAKKMEPKQAMLWKQMQKEAQGAACVDTSSRTLEMWSSTKQILALALYVGAA